MSERTITGSCHCGSVRVEADVDLAATSSKCNCSICTKLRAWGFIVQPAALRLLAGEQDLSTYEWGGRISKRYFCKHCGVHVFSRGHLKEIGGDFASVNVATLDFTPAELARIPVRYCDGRENNWTSAPAEIRYL